MAKLLTILALGSALVVIGWSDREPRVPENQVSEKIRNSHPAFSVRIEVDRPSRVYLEGEELQLTVRSGRNGYLYVINRRSDGQAVCIFPNQFWQDNRITANCPLTLPVD